MRTCRLFTLGTILHKGSRHRQAKPGSTSGDKDYFATLVEEGIDSEIGQSRGAHGGD